MGNIVIGGEVAGGAAGGVNALLGDDALVQHGLHDGVIVAPGVDGLRLLYQAVLFQDVLVEEDVAVLGVVTQGGNAVKAAAEGVRANVILDQFHGLGGVFIHVIGDVHHQALGVVAGNGVGKQADDVHALAGRQGGRALGAPVAAGVIDHVDADVDLLTAVGIDGSADALAMVAAVAAHVIIGEDDFSSLFIFNHFVLVSGVAGVGVGVGVRRLVAALGTGSKQTDEQAGNQQQGQNHFQLFHCVLSFFSILRFVSPNS